MHSIEVPAEVRAALDALDAADAAIRALDFDALHPVVRLRALERMEASRRRQIAVSHGVIAGLAGEGPGNVGGPVHKSSPTACGSVTPRRAGGFGKPSSCRRA